MEMVASGSAAEQSPEEIHRLVTWSSSLPIAWRLYLPEVWCQDAKRCQQAGVPEGIAFQTKPEIALEQIRQAMEQQVPVGVVLADAGYGKGTQFRTDLTQLGLQYVVGIEPNVHPRIQMGDF